LQAASETLRRDAIRRVFVGRKRRFALRMTPMIDVVFLLLIFFLVAARWRPREDFLPLKLPASTAKFGALGKPEPLTIRISASQDGCEVQVGALEPVQIERRAAGDGLQLLAGRIKECLASQKRFTSDPVEIVCGPAVKWEHLARIYNLLYGSGFSDITFQMTE